METNQINPDQQTIFQVQRYYVKEVNYKTSSVPLIFKEKEQPTSSMELQVKHDVLEPNHFEVVLSMHIATKINERTAYIIDIQQAGIFKLEGFTEQQLTQLLRAYCPSLLYPYLCRAISDITIQAGFPPLLLSPINFEQLFLQEQAKANKDNNLNTTDIPQQTSEAVSTTVMQ